MSLFSIIMPLYNKENEVLTAVNSVLSQSLFDFELIIVNDGSTDKGPEIVKKIIDPRIKFIEQNNAGVSAARNRGVQESKYHIVAFLDADDEWKPTFLETIYGLRKRFEKCSVFATGYSYLEQDGTERRPVINGIPPHPWQGILENYFYIASMSDPPLCSSAIAVTKEAINFINGFPVGIKSGEDLLTWARLAVKYPIAYNTIPLALFRQRSSRHERPTRSPEYPDVVGISLKKLLGEVEESHRESLKFYIAWWHKNRASMHFRLRQRSKALSEIVQMGYHRMDKKFLMYIGCIFLPYSLIQKLVLLRNKKEQIKPEKSI